MIIQDKYIKTTKIQNNMVFLKEDGSLDIERINKLPVEEHMNMLGEFTSKQMDEYLSSLPINESNECPRNIIVDYTLEDEIKRGTVVEADAFLNKRYIFKQMKIQHYLNEDKRLPKISVSFSTQLAAQIEAIYSCNKENTDGLIQFSEYLETL